MSNANGGMVNFANFGTKFQRKLGQVMFEEHLFADQMFEVLENEFFTVGYVREFIRSIKDYKEKYGVFPSYDIMDTVITTQMDDMSDIVKKQVMEYFTDMKSSVVQDKEFIKGNSLDFCKRQALKRALLEVVGSVESGSYEDAARTIESALALGSNRDMGHTIIDDFEARYMLQPRVPIPTGQKALDDLIGGGLAKKEFGIFVGGTGCHARGAEIMLYSGDTLLVEDVRVGELLMGPDGRSRVVTRLYRGTSDMYRITPDVGKSFVVNGEHILSLKHYKTGKVVNLSVNAYRDRNDEFKSIYKLYKVIIDRDLGDEFIDRQPSKDSLLSDFRLSSEGRDDFFGFNLSGDHLYLMSDFTVTHNSGKSIQMVNFATDAILNGYNVIYYTLELQDSVVGKRFDSCITGFPMSELDSNKEFVYQGLSDKVTGKLIIKEYPPGYCTVAMMKNHIEKTSRTLFKPDLIIVDYADIMKVVVSKGDSRYDALGSLYTELRGIASHYNVALWTVSQVNRTGYSSELVSVDNLSDAFNKAFIADLIVTLQRSPAQKQKNEATFFLAKNRNGPDGIILKGRVNPGCMQVNIDGEKSFEEHSTDQKDLQKDLKDRIFNKFSNLKNS